MINCNECKFLKIGVDDIKGECRYNPPSMDNNGYGFWPLIILNINNPGCHKGELIDNRLDEISKNILENPQV